MKRTIFFCVSSFHVNKFYFEKLFEIVAVMARFEHIKRRGLWSECLQNLNTNYGENGGTGICVICNEEIKVTSQEARKSVAGRNIWWR